MKNNIDKENNTLKIITSFILLITIVILILICLKPNSKNNYEKKEKKIHFAELAIELKVNEEKEVKIQNESNEKISFNKENDNIKITCNEEKCLIKALQIGTSAVEAKTQNEKSTLKIKIIGDKEIYYYKDETVLMSYEKKENPIYVYNCQTANCKAIENTNYNLLIKDEDYYIINLKSQTKVKINNLDNITNIQINDDENKVFGFILDNKEFFNLELNKATIKLNNDETFGTFLPFLNAIVVNNNDGLIKDINNNNIIFTAKNYIVDINLINLNQHYYYLVTTDPIDQINNLYDKSWNLKLSNFHEYNIFNNQLIINDEKYIYTYNEKIEKTKQSKKYQLVGNILDQYIIVIDNNDLNLINYNEELIHKFTTLNDKTTYHKYLSGYYEENNIKGIYAVVEDKTLGKNNNGEPLGYEYYFDPENNQSGKIKTVIGGYAKPILYLYPEKDNTKISIIFAKNQLLSTTYPKYKQKWEVNANKDGSLYINDQYYYALYWEENKYQYKNFEEGFYVTKDNAINFLEEKLTILGLNAKERNEFIMYWLPVLEKNEKSLVYFEQTTERENFNKLLIEPKPDSLLRIAIHIKKVDKEIKIKEQVLNTFKRNGFTAVEWGGISY